MQRLRQLLIGSLALLVFIMLMAPPVFGYPTGDEPRLAGQDRYETAAAIAREGRTQSDYAILVSGENFPDALVASPLAQKYGAPILLSRTSSLPDATKQTLTDLKVKQVILVGGPGVLSAHLFNELSNMGLKPSRLAGKDRYETSIAVANEFSGMSEAVIVTGEDFADALSVSPIAAYKNMPIILVPRDYINSVTQALIKNNPISKTYVIGNTDSISDQVAGKFPNPERITGTTKYDRNINIIKRFEAVINGDKVLLATGNNYADAMAGSAYAAKIQAPIVLVSSTMSRSTTNYLQANLAERAVCILGGEGAVSRSIFNNIGSSRGSDKDSRQDSKSDPLRQLGSNAAKYALVFGSADAPMYSTAAAAKANMVEVTIDVWKLSTNGEKYPATLTVTVNQAISDMIRSIFKEIFEGTEKFPIYSVQGYSWRGGTSEHNYGLAVDINPNENYMIKSNGTVSAGSFWNPAKSPYSIPENGEVVNIFKKYGFAWGGNAWKSSNDYMHFSYFGK